VIRDNLDPFLDLLDEVLNTPGMREEDFEKLRRETLADIVQMRDDDQSLAYRHFRALLFGDHPYGRSTVGLHRDVSSLGWTDVQQAFGSVLRRAPVLVGLAGDFDEDHMRERLQPVLERFSDRTLAPPAAADPAPPRGVRVRLVDKPARTQSQIYLGHLGLRADEETYFSTALLNTAFGGTFTARLSREVRQDRGWSYGAYSRILRSKMRDAFYLWTFPALENMVDCVGLELDLLRGLRKDGLSREEFDFARRYLDNHFLFAVETASLRVALALRQEVLELPGDFYETYRQNVRGVEHEQVQQAARAFVDPDNLCICALCTADQVRPALEKRLGEDASIEVVPYDSDA
jgi:zinc protease